MISATIGSATYKINNLVVDYDICASSGKATFSVAPSSEITPFALVTIFVNSEVIFSGFVDTVTTTAMKEKVVNCESALILAERTWFRETYSSSGESTTYWSNLFFEKAQITRYTIQNMPVNVPEEHSWGMQTALEALKNIGQMTDSKLYPRRDGEIMLRPMTTSADGIAKTITKYEELNTALTEETIRTCAIVWGRDCMAEERQTSPYVHETRTTAISTDLIQQESAARRLAKKILATFKDPMYVVTVRIDGDPYLSLNDFVVTPVASGPITSLKHEYNAEKFTTTVTIGRICPDFFGLALVAPPIYAATVGYGVWKSETSGRTWYDISGEVLAGQTVVALHWDDPYLWAITSHGIYKGDGAGTWEACAVEDCFEVSFEEHTYQVYLDDVTFVDIITSTDYVFIVGYDVTSKHTVVLVSRNRSYFDRIFMV